MLYHGKANRKPTGGLYRKLSKKKKMNIGSDFVPVKIGKEKRAEKKTYGGGSKFSLHQVEIANVLNPETKKAQKAKIITVKENPANPHFVRMNIITMGAVIETEAGLAKVTSRPTQHGIVNAVLIKK
ncbi:MAG: 30S ribosomal protein S8e [Candidatus Aenigmarchaeota archaeon]|nr:30S ribosomal protein S8e [Candidatus Aenigmarchaeota archaeon]